MKKKFIVFALTLCMTASLALSGCQKKYVTLGDYKGLKLEKVIPEVTDDEVQGEIDTALEDNATSTEITDRAAKEGDTVTMDFEGKINGTPFEGGTAEDYDLELGSGEFIEGFEEQLIGVKKDDKKDVTVTFPEDYGDDNLNGKEAVFSVTVKSIKQITPATYNDEFVSSISDYKNTADYEENLKNELLASKEEDSEYTLKDDAINAVIEGSTFNGYPDELYEKCKKQVDESNAYYAELFGVTIEDLAGSEEDIKQTVISTVNEQLAIEAIAEKEKISVTDEEYKSYVNDNLEYYEVSSVEEFEQNNDKDSVMSELLKDKVCQFLVDNAQVTEVTEDEKYSDDGEGDEFGDETEPPMDDAETDDSEADDSEAPQSESDTAA